MKSLVSKQEENQVGLMCMQLGLVILAREGKCKAPRKNNCASYSCAGPKVLPSVQTEGEHSWWKYFMQRLAINGVPKTLEVILKTVERCNINCTYCYFF